jgi:hypothetical protein
MLNPHVTPNNAADDCHSLEDDLQQANFKLLFDTKKHAEIQS